MEKQALKDLIYGSISELIHDDRYFDYWKKFTPEGEKAMIEFFNAVSSVMIRIDKENLDRRSKEIVMNSLKEQKD